MTMDRILTIKISGNISIWNETLKSMSAPEVPGHLHYDDTEGKPAITTRNLVYSARTLSVVLQHDVFSSIDMTITDFAERKKGFPYIREIMNGLQLYNSRNKCFRLDENLSKSLGQFAGFVRKRHNPNFISLATWEDFVKWTLYYEIYFTNS